MLRDLLKEGGLYTLANLLTKGVSLLLIPFYTAYFSPTDYGIVDILVVFGTILTTITSLQLNQGLGRYVGEPSIDEKEKKILASSAVWFSLILYCAVFVLLILFPHPFIRLLSNEEVQIPVNTFILAVGAVSINGIFYLLGVYLRFLRKTKPYAVLSFLHAILNIITTIYLVLYLDKGINGIYVASIAVAPAIIILQLISLKGHLVFALSHEQLKKLFKFCIPLIPAAVAYVALNFIDRIFIKEYLSFEQEGIYGVANKFASAISIVVMGFSSALAPILYQKHNQNWVKSELGRIFKLFFGVGTIVVLTLSLFSYETLVIFTQEDYYSAYRVMPLLYLSMLFTGIGMFAPGLHLSERTKIIPYIVLISCVINAILNYLLISTYHLIGAAFATSLSVFINNAIFFYFSQKFFKMEYPLVKMLLSSVIFLFFLIGGSYYLFSFNLAQEVQILARILIVLIYTFLLIKLDILDLTKLSGILKK